MAITISPADITSIANVLQAALPLGAEIVAGIKAVLAVKYSTETIDEILFKWQADFDEATKNVSSIA